MCYIKNNISCFHTISVVNDMLEMLTAPYPKIRCSACIFIIIIICYNVLYLDFNHIMGRKMADAWNCFDINFKIMEKYDVSVKT